MVNRIQIDFPCDVEFPEGFERTLDALIGMVCEKYEKENPTRTMWPAGCGSKPIGNYMNGGVGMEFDDSIFSIEVAEREAYEKELKRRDPVMDKPEQVERLELVIESLRAELKTVAAERDSLRQPW